MLVNYSDFAYSVNIKYEITCGFVKDRMEANEEVMKCYDLFFCAKELSENVMNAIKAK